MLPGAIFLAKWDNEDVEKNELSFLEGDRIKAIAAIDDSYWEGTNLRTKKKGKFPVNYVDTSPNPAAIEASAHSFEAANSLASVKLNGPLTNDVGEEDCIHGDEGMVCNDDQKWIQCEACEKWRKVSEMIDAESLPKMWVCEMNTWDPNRASCHVPQETSNDVIDGKRRLKKSLKLLLASEPLPLSAEANEKQQQYLPDFKRCLEEFTATPHEAEKDYRLGFDAALCELNAEEEKLEKALAEFKQQDPEKKSTAVAMDTTASEEEGNMSMQTDEFKEQKLLVNDSDQMYSKQDPKPSMCSLQNTASSSIGAAVPMTTIPTIFLPCLARLIQGSPLTLSALAQQVLDVFKSISSDTVSDSSEVVVSQEVNSSSTNEDYSAVSRILASLDLKAIVAQIPLIAERKLYGATRNRKNSIPVNEDEGLAQLYRWEVISLTTHFLPEHREIVTQVQKERKKNGMRVRTLKRILDLALKQPFDAQKVRLEEEKLQKAAAEENARKQKQAQKEAKDMEKRRLEELKRQEIEAKKVAQAAGKAKKEAEKAEKQAERDRIAEEKRAQQAAKEAEVAAQRAKDEARKNHFKGFFSKPKATGQSSFTKSVSSPADKEKQAENVSATKNNGAGLPLSNEIISRLSFDISAHDAAIAARPSFDELSRTLRQNDRRGSISRGKALQRKHRPKFILKQVSTCNVENADFGQPVFSELKKKTFRNRMKHLQFHEDERPPYWGTWTKESRIITGRRPMKKDTTDLAARVITDSDGTSSLSASFEPVKMMKKVNSGLRLNYEVDSEAEWEEEEPGEDLDGENNDDGEELEEDGLDYDDGWLRPDDQLDSDDEGEGVLIPKVSTEEAVQHRMDVPVLLGPFIQPESVPAESEQSPTQNLALEHVVKYRALAMPWTATAASSPHHNQTQGSHLSPSSVIVGTLPMRVRVPLLASLEGFDPTPREPEKTKRSSMNGHEKDEDGSKPKVAKKRAFDEAQLPKLAEIIHKDSASLDKIIDKFLEECPGPSKNEVKNAIKRVADKQGKGWAVKSEFVDKFNLPDKAHKLGVVQGLKMAPPDKPISTSQAATQRSSIVTALQKGNSGLQVVNSHDLIGSKVRKFFKNHGWYIGTISAYRAKGSSSSTQGAAPLEEDLWNVTWSDGDSEEMSASELHEAIEKFKMSETVSDAQNLSTVASQDKNDEALLVECKWDSHTEEGTKELDFEEGDQIHVMRMITDEVWFGKNTRTDNVGEFPVSYVDLSKSSTNILRAMKENMGMGASGKN